MEMQGELMIRIGICDDEELMIEIMKDFCGVYLAEKGVDYSLISFDSGEAALKYCGEKESKGLDLLFLDIGLREMDGIAVKNVLAKNANVHRIVFVSGYQERMPDAFGQKTIGFITKPPRREQIRRILQTMLEEMEEEQQFVEVRNVGNIKSIQLKLEKIAYIRAKGNYTEIYFYKPEKELERLVTVKKLGEWEKELQGGHIIRVHKSHMVNLAHAVLGKHEVMIRDMGLKIPIGRVYKNDLKKQYVEYVKERMRKKM